MHNAWNAAATPAAVKAASCRRRHLAVVQEKEGPRQRGSRLSISANDDDTSHP